MSEIQEREDNTPLHRFHNGRYECDDLIFDTACFDVGAATHLITVKSMTLCLSVNEAHLAQAKVAQPSYKILSLHCGDVSVGAELVRHSLDDVSCLL